MRHFSAGQLADYLSRVEVSPVLLDVRELWEYDICHIHDSTLLPMGQIAGRVQELDKDAETVVICHHGVRSLQVCYFLTSAGFTNLINLSGGLAAWALDIDKDMATY